MKRRIIAARVKPPALLGRILGMATPFPSANGARPAAPLVRKLSHHVAFDRADLEALDRAIARDVRRLDNGVPIFEQGEPLRSIAVLIDGFAVRERLLADGRRQIVAILLPGDLCDFNAFMMARSDSRCRAVGAARVAGIDRHMLNELNQLQPKIGQALWWEAMVNASLQRDWAANLAARRAEPRLANLFCTLLARARLAGIEQDGAFPWPFTQADIANACGLTQEHLNRTLRALRSKGLVELEPGRIAFGNIGDLVALGEFDEGHLHAAEDVLPVDTTPASPAPPPAMVMIGG